MNYIKFPMPSGDVGIKFGLIAHERIMTDKNRKLWFDGDGNLKIVGIAKIVHSGYVNNCFNQDEEAIYEVEDFLRQISAMEKTEDIELLTKTIDLWKNCEDMKQVVEKNSAEKKSLTE